MILFIFLMLICIAVLGIVLILRAAADRTLAIQQDLNRHAQSLGYPCFFCTIGAIRDPIRIDCVHRLFAVKTQRGRNAVLPIGEIEQIMTNPSRRRTKITIVLRDAPPLCIRADARLAAQIVQYTKDHCAPEHTAY